MSGRPAVVGLIITLVLTFGLIQAVQAQSGNIAAVEYWELLEELRSALREEPGAAPLNDLAMRIVAVDAVDLADGTRLPVDHRYLTALLTADPPASARALAVLDQAFAFRSSRIDRGFSQADLDALNTILSGPEYLWPAEAGPNPLAEIWQRFLNWAARLVARLFSGAALGPVANTALIAGIALLLGLILRFVYVHSIRTMIREARASPETRIPSGLTADGAVERARSLSESGDLREAVRFLYLAALLSLEERGRIRLDRAHTNRELLSDLSPWSELAARFKSVVEIFDRVWYGFQPITREEFGRYADTVAALGKHE